MELPPCGEFQSRTNLVMLVIVLEFTVPNEFFTVYKKRLKIKDYISAFHCTQSKLCCLETLMQLGITINNVTATTGLSAGTGKLCIFGHLGLVFIWSCFVSCLLLLLYYVICAPVLTEGTATNFQS